MYLNKFVKNIKLSFSEVEFPANGELFITSANHIFDANQATEQLSDKKWQDIDLRLLIHNRDRISYLTPFGFRFLIPAFLIAITTKPKEVDVMKDNVFFFLIPSDKPTSQKLLSESVEILTVSQSEAILDFFENYEKFFPSSEWSLSNTDKLQIQRGIEYWKNLVKNK